MTVLLIYKIFNTYINISGEILSDEEITTNQLPTLLLILNY